MAILKCKMCGGAMEIQPGSTVGECQYCGTLQTLPRLKDDRRANMLNRANHYRRSNEFDKATSLYEQILAEDDSDAELYWALVLCRYGIKYEKDPATGKQLPTINRMQYASILSDADFKTACSKADAEQKKLYVAEAKRINEIQKGILAISARETPFDVFISYKEKDENGQRTLDSVLATDIYEYLTKENMKVFLSRITLEDKLGTEYEPYIFAALNSAKVMVVVGTKPEHFNAVWVKNEWSRYLALIQKGAEKTLIPAYRDMDPYDLPEEFSNLVAQDMAKIGFKQDLKRGIKKIIDADKPKEESQRTVVSSGPTLQSQLKRGYMALEDQDWSSADTFFDKALDMDPECAEAYLGKALADAKQVSLAAFAESRMQRRPQSPGIAYCDIDGTFIHSTAETYAIPFYYPEPGIIDRFNLCKREYSVWAPRWEGLLLAERAYWNGDRYMSRALRFAKGKTADSLQRIRQRSERNLEQALQRSREEDQERLFQSQQDYANALRETAESVRAESLAAGQQREGDFQSFYRQMQNAKSPEDFEALQKKEYPGLSGYRNFDQLFRQCGQNAQYMRDQAAARAADLERQRHEQNIQNQKIREKKDKKKARQSKLFSFVGFLYYTYGIIITIYLFASEGEAVFKIKLSTLTAVFLALIILRSYFAGSSGGGAPVLSTIFVFGAFCLGSCTAVRTFIDNYGTYLYHEKIGHHTWKMMIFLMSEGDEFMLKYCAAAIIGTLLVVWIVNAIGKSVRKKLV